MSAIQDAYEAGDADAYIDALRDHRGFSAMFDGGIDPDVEAGLRADFEADPLRQEQGFSLDKLGEIWDAFQEGGIGAAWNSLVSIFTGAADPQVATLDSSAQLGQAAAQGVSDEAAAAYNRAIGINGPGLS